MWKTVPDVVHSDIPRELDKVTIPPYRVEPPDILLIEAVHNIRPPKDKLRAGDQIIIRVGNTLPIDPEEDEISAEYKRINGLFQIETNGTIDLGPVYGTVHLEGLDFEEMKIAIDKHLKESVGLRDPQVSISMPDVAGKQAIEGNHLVRPDGSVSLGVYGSVYVAGKTLDQIKIDTEKHLEQFIHEPEIHVDVLAYNSKVYYVITDGGGIGEQVQRLPFTGNETVLDAIANIQGLSAASSKHIWVARPSPAGVEVAQNMEVDWRAITQDGITTTNYQILPGDRIFIKADDLVTFNNFISKVIAPFERMMGFTLLGYSTVRRTQQSRSSFNSNSGGGF
jgi:protein involved in polysaccharide export with SLBB domain